jgi:nitrite reductase/ring-hydroxylating ferredoxin subunit
MKWYKIPEIQNFDQPFIKRVKAGDKSICLVGYNDEVFAVSAMCPHAGGDLSEGWCNNEKLVCPYHRYSYDLRTGKGSKGQNDYINTYPVEIRDNNIYIGVLSFWERIKQGFNT